jgi:hypothetical protein
VRNKRERREKQSAPLLSITGESVMQHYGFEQWIDFARGVAPEALSSAMEEHLKIGCQACAHELASWKTVYGFASGEPLCAPPPDLVQTVKFALSSGASRPSPSRSQEIAQLVFDSFAQPQLQGVRSTQSMGRQLLYKAGPLMIDMHLQSVENSSRRSLTGQIMNAEQAESEMGELHVHLLSGRKELAHTHTDRFGEFYIEYDPERNLQLSLEVSPSKDVYVHLDESLWRTPFVG